MNAKDKFSRQVRNGKVVYVPASNPRSRPAPAHPSSVRLFGVLQSSLEFMLLSGMAITVLGLSWLSFQVITDPDVAFWLNQFLPTSQDEQIAAHQPQTLQKILKRLQKQDAFPGTPIVLAADQEVENPLLATKDILIPIYDKDCAKISCQRLQTLHVYRSLKLPALLRIFQGTRYYRLLDRVVVRGPQESTLANLANNPRLVSGSTQSLPLFRIEPYQPAPQPGSWLRLTGLRTEGSATSAYGQVMYFHPREAHLVLMLDWASPSGGYPRWQQVTGDQQPELVVQQTVGLEPQFAVYQMRPAPRGDLQLEHISLAKPAFSNQGYAQGLLLARSGLWSPAQQWLLSVKKKFPQQWSTKAQSQLDYINLHAQVAQAQVQQTSASSMQNIVAQLVNGEWKSALQVFLAADTDPAEVREMLLNDPGRLTARVDAFLTVHPEDGNAIAWGTMIRHLQDDPKAALVWAQQKTKNKTALQKIQKLLKRLDQPRYTPKESPPTVPQAQPPARSRSSQQQTDQPNQQLATPKQSSSSGGPSPAVSEGETAPREEEPPVSSPTVSPEPGPTDQSIESSPEQ